MSTENPDQAGKPVLTERDASWHEAQAGIAAREQAVAAGMDPAHFRALLLPEAAPIHIRGEKLHHAALLVTQCFTLHRELFVHAAQEQVAGLLTAAQEGADFTVDQLRALSHLGFIFTRPLDAYDLLDHDTLSDPFAGTESAEELKVKRRRLFDRAAAHATAEWLAEDFFLLIAHLVRQSRARSAVEVGK
jgi:hypothetical protein